MVFDKPLWRHQGRRNTRISASMANQGGWNAQTTAAIALAMTRPQSCLAVGTLPIALLIGGSTPVTITWPITFDNTGYRIDLADVVNGLTLTVASRTQTGCVVTATAALAVSLGAKFLAYAVG